MYYSKININTKLCLSLFPPLTQPFSKQQLEINLSTPLLTSTLPLVQFMCSDSATPTPHPYLVI